MTDYTKILDAVQAQAKAQDAFARKNYELFGEIGESVATLTDRVENMEAHASNPGKLAGSPEQREHKARFTAWLRSPHDSGAKNSLADFESHERKNLNIGTGSDGGFAVPEEIALDIERLELKLSPVRRLVRVVKTASSDYKHLLNIRGTSSGWVGESDSRTETTTPSLREIVPTFGEIYAYLHVTEWALDDVFFNVGAWLAEEVAQDFALAEGAAVISGNGTNKPTGMLNTTPVATDDFASPLRAAAAYEFIASLSTSSPAVAEIEADSLIDLVFAVNSAYRARASSIYSGSYPAAVK
ncbi:MAG TPA: phage major capsid protein [Thermohalobaculum sp.]|nr:phage major capsid protein [Thermohalobaculum sp.]